MDVTKIPGETTLDYLYIHKSTQKLTVSITAMASMQGLVRDDQSGVLYRPGVADPYGTPPAPGTPEVHNINWGGYGSVQATPQPMQVINNIAPTPPLGKWEEIFVLPAQESPSQPSAQHDSANLAKLIVLPWKGERVDTNA